MKKISFSAHRFQSICHSVFSQGEFQVAEEIQSYEGAREAFYFLSASAGDNLRMTGIFIAMAEAMA